MRMSRRRGFTLIEIMIVIAIIALLIAISIPGFIRARDFSRTKRIQKDLVAIDDAARQYVIEYSLGPSDAMPSLQDLVELGYLRTMPRPPLAGEYVAGTAYSELGAIDPDSYPRFVDASGREHPERVHPDLLP